MKEKVIFQGAEAVIVLRDKEIIKKRIKKSYRINEIDDRIRKLRTRNEARLIGRAGKVIKVPFVKNVDENLKEIIMDFIDGEKLSLCLDDFSLVKQKRILRKIGEGVSKIHDAGIIHGDLTTSNFLLHERDVYFIDFGLGFMSDKFEDRAVDLHLFKQAMNAKHFSYSDILFDEFIEGYKNSKDFGIVIERLKAVEKRGRYKH